MLLIINLNNRTNMFQQTESSLKIGPNPNKAGTIGAPQFSIIGPPLILLFEFAPDPIIVLILSIATAAIAAPLSQE